MKNIWLINPYCSPPEKESRLRTIKFAQYLELDGYVTTIFAGSEVHNTDFNYIDINVKYIEKKYDGIKFVQIKNTNYKNNGFKRLYSLWQFYHTFSKNFKLFGKPDLILHTLTVPFGKNVEKIAKYFGAKYFCEVLDLWPESFIAFGLLRKNNPIVSILRKYEKKFYINADKLFFSMEGGEDYIVERGWNKKRKLFSNISLDKIHHINNGVDLKEFYTNSKNYILPDCIHRKGEYKVVYLGSIRLANDVKQLVDAANLLKNTNIVIYIYGDGNDRSFLEKYVKDNSISNVIFKERWIDIKFVPAVLKTSDLNILNYQSNYIFKYGGSQSKLFQYLASGKPICSNVEMGYCLINKYRLGIAKKFNTEMQYAEAIKTISQYPKDRLIEISKQSRALVEKYDYYYLTKELESYFDFAD